MADNRKSAKKNRVVIYIFRSLGIFHCQYVMFFGDRETLRVDKETGHRSALLDHFFVTWSVIKFDDLMRP